MGSLGVHRLEPQRLLLVAVMSENWSCGYWVSTSPDDPDAHVCGKPAVVVAQPNAPHLYEAGHDDRGYCQVHATTKRLEHLIATGWSLAWLD